MTYKDKRNLQQLLHWALNTYFENAETSTCLNEVKYELTAVWDSMNSSGEIVTSEFNDPLGEPLY